MKALVAHLSKTIINTPAVRDAMLAVDRGDFVPPTCTAAYDDCPQSLGCGQTVSAPHMHAYALEILWPAIERAGAGARVLDCGCGSGILLPLFRQLVGDEGSVVGVDVVPQLVTVSRLNVAKNHQAYLDDGSIRIQLADAWLEDDVDTKNPSLGTFDAIHVGAAARILPPALVHRLRPGGRIVIPIGTEQQQLYVVDKDQDGHVTQTPLMGVRYVPLVEPKQ